ncbi:Rieske 2Fe-2S domain-containing protein [Streptomyces sp. JJ66]|uniref:Rieske 2Fe-2S domain-containing protein n=1 Tax=Streptomyces sp. JJ66 TaxID=2803843 RepID=UPI001C566F87|nr:Rieske 2Fe-2S domain-containing protein [Streptomyces sp. JJ66]MBW1600716.1 Rieske 2Fe-2S domain-containing protein [Streptomyces sp. JJ66]
MTTAASEDARGTGGDLPNTPCPEGAQLHPDSRQAPQSPRVQQVSERLILIEAGGRQLLADATCPHRKGRMRYGHLDADRMVIRCPLHHSAFDLQGGGRRVAGPACDALRIVAELPAGAPVPPGDELRRLEGRLNAAD